MRWQNAYGIRGAAAGTLLLTVCLWTACACAQGTHLQVRRISPSGVNVPSSQEAVIQFDRPVVPLGHMGRASTSLPVTVRPDPGCEWRWLDPSELACRLPAQHRFAPATRYTITVGTALAALDGSHLATPVTGTFTTLRPMVQWADIDRWRSPVMPAFTVVANLPVTAAQLAQHMHFLDARHHRTAVRVEPVKQERTWPILLPVPGLPGAVIFVEHPEPAAPLDEKAAPAAGRRVWRVLPASPLAPSVEYVLLAAPGMRTLLGQLGSAKQKAVAEGSTFGAFTLRGASCDDRTGESINVRVGAKQALRCRPGSVALQFASPVPASALSSTRWSPALPIQGLHDIHWQGARDCNDQTYADAEAGSRPVDYRLPIMLAPMQSYRITVPAGVKDCFGRTLARPVTMSLRTGHYAPAVTDVYSNAVLEAGLQTVVPVGFVNLDALSLRWQHLDARALAHGTEPAAAATENLLKRPNLVGTQDQFVRGPLGLRKLLAGGSGVVWGSLRWQLQRHDPRHHATNFFGEVTPYEVLAKAGHYGTLVWVSRLDDGEPVADAQVRLVTSPHGQLHPLTTIGSTVTTNAAGLAMLHGTIDLPSGWNPWRIDADASGVYVVVTKGGQSAVLPLRLDFERGVEEASSFVLESDTEPRHGHLRAWAVTQQGIYKPGEDVRFALFVRAQGNTSLEPAPALDYTLKIVDDKRNTVFERKDVKLSAYGGMHGTWHIPKSAGLHRYHFLLSWPGKDGGMATAGSFLVADFVPADFTVRTQARGTRLGPGASVPVRVTATLHSGGPYTDADVKVTAQLLAKDFAPNTPVASRFSFGDGQPLPDPATLATSHTWLDHSGRADTSVVVPADSKAVYGDVSIVGEVQSGRGKWIANVATLPYAARGRFVGLRTDDWVQTAGKAFKVVYLVVDPAGTPAAGSPVDLTLQRQVITYARGVQEDTRMPVEHTTWHDVHVCNARSGRAPGTCMFTATRAGQYRVVAKVTDAHRRVQRSVIETWVTGPGAVTWAFDGGVTLVPDKASYHVGGTAHVLVQNPHPGARALVTVERFGTLWKKVLTLKGAAPVIDVPIQPDDFPGAFLSVAIFAPRSAPPADPDKGQPVLAIGYVALKVTGAGEALHVKVTPAHDRYKPRQDVTVDVAVRGHAGAPSGKTRLVVAVVDQGVLDQLDDGVRYYDPRATFYAPPGGPDVNNFDLAAALVTALRPKPAPPKAHAGAQMLSAVEVSARIIPPPPPPPPAPPAVMEVAGNARPGEPGRNAAGPTVRSLFAHAAYWNADLGTDASGHARFQFKLPDNLTRWRILVVAMQPGAAMGLGDGSVRVNLPLQVQPALPNQVHVGDRFAAAFGVANRTRSPLHVVARITAQGVIAGGKAHAGQTLDIASFAHALSSLPLVAIAPGDITLTAVAQAGKLGDAVKMHVPVRVAGTAVVAAEYGSISGESASVPVKVPATALSGGSAVSVTFAPTLVGGLDGAFAVMRDDPLQTWEMRLSRSVLASDYLQLKPLLGNAMHWPDAAPTIDVSLAAATDYQAPNGGMAFWVARDEFVSPYLSVYTALAFDWLQASGHEPSRAVVAKLRNYLREEVMGGHHAPVLKAGALAALAMSPQGERKTSGVHNLLRDLPRMRLFGQALLLDAAVASHDRTSADAIVKSLFNHAEESSGEVSFNERREGIYVDWLATPLRTNCAILDALSRYHAAWGDENLVGAAPQKLMRWVASRRRNQGGWPNSQENVFCTTATVHYANAYEAPVSALAGTLTLPGHAPSTVRFASRATPAATLAGPVVERGQTFHVKLGRSGQGRLYYGVRVHYTLPASALDAADAGMTVTRNYRVKRGSAWQPITATTVLKRGDVVRVDLLVDTPTERHHVVLTDPLPGAFEAVNRQLATASPLLPSRQPTTGILMFDGGEWPNMAIVTGGFYHRETAFDAVRFFADNLPAGHYHLVYAAQVVASGSFTAPAPTIREIYHPDVFGRGLPQHVNVAMPRQ